VNRPITASHTSGEAADGVAFGIFVIFLAVPCSPAFASVRVLSFPGTPAAADFLLAFIMLMLNRHLFSMAFATNLHLLLNFESNQLVTSALSFSALFYFPHFIFHQHGPFNTSSLSATDNELTQILSRLKLI